MRYELIIHWSKEDNAFLVEVPELPGCMAASASCEEAVANDQTVIAEWIETAHLPFVALAKEGSVNRPIPEPNGKLAYT